MYDLSEPTIVGFLLSLIVLIVFFVMANRLKIIIDNTKSAVSTSYLDDSFKYQFAGDMENARKAYLMYVYGRWKKEKPFYESNENKKQEGIGKFMSKYDVRLQELGGKWPNLDNFDFMKRKNSTNDPFNFESEVEIKD